MPPRVLLVSRSLPCHVRGGLEEHVVELARGLVELGARVDLLTTPLPAGGRAELERDGLAVHEVAGCPPGRYSLAYFRRVGEAIARLHADRAFEVIHGQEFGFGFERFDAPLYKDTRIVLSVHGTITSETPLHHDVFPSLTPREKFWAFGRFGRRWLFAPTWLASLDRADRLLVDSEFTQRELVRQRPPLAVKIRLVPLGVDLTAFPEVERVEARRALGWPDSPEAAPVLLTVGRLEWQKGHTLALRALAGLLGRSWRYVVAGEGSERSRLEAEARELGISGQVEFLGRVDDATRARLLAGADLFLWPERTHPAFGLAGLEAMAMGTPLLAARRGAIPELVNAARGGWLADWETGEATEELKRLLSNPERLADAREGLRGRTMQGFTRSAMAEATLEAYGKNELARPRD